MATKKTKTTNVNVGLADKANKILEESAIINDRSKQREAVARLKHHLEYFGSNWTKKD